MLSIGSIAHSSPAPAIVRARELVVLRDRPAALNVLKEAISVEKVGSRRAELLREQSRLASLFLTNEGQRAYELAESIRYSGQPSFMSKYDEAEKLEGPNWQILVGRGLGHLQQKNCQKALLDLSAAEALDPQREEVAILRAKAEVCDGVPVLSQTDAKLDTVKNWSLFKKTFLAQRAFEEGRSEEALKMAREISQLDDQFPMGYYWAWQSLKGEVKQGMDEGLRYLKLCKNLGAAVRRKYFLEPDLCINTEAVEEFIKKWESQSQ